MTLDLEPLALPIRIDTDGAVRVGPTRIALEMVLWKYQDGATVQGIVERFPTLAVADVHAVLAWYFRHREQADAYLIEARRIGDELRAQAEAGPGNAELRARLIARRDLMLAQRSK